MPSWYKNLGRFRKRNNKKLKEKIKNQFTKDLEDEDKEKNLTKALDVNFTFIYLHKIF